LNRWALGGTGTENGLYLLVDPSGARRWIVRVVVKGQRIRRGGPLRTDFGLGGADVVTLPEARAKALEYRRLAKAGLSPRHNAKRDIPTFEEMARRVHSDRLPTWKNEKHGAQWINTLADYAFPRSAARRCLTLVSRRYCPVSLPSGLQNRRRRDDWLNGLAQCWTSPAQIAFVKGEPCCIHQSGECAAGGDCQAKAPFCNWLARRACLLR
jgi:hypothetical protein